MRQDSFSDAGFEKYRKKTRKEQFLEEMEAIIPWKEWKDSFPSALEELQSSVPCSENPKLKNIEALVDGDGQVTLGYMGPVGCVAVANEESNTLAMLRRRPGESLTELLERLDHAIERAIEYDEYVDEVNEP